jgi:hypothetical protein
MLSMLDTDMHRVVEPGVFELMVGPSSDRTSKVRLTVGNANGEPGHPMQPPPAGSESGVVSTFDDGKIAANYGSWMGVGDQMNGGKSTATLAIVQPGAANTKGALQVTGEVMAGSPVAWAGALFFPGATPEQSVNLSAKKTISFWAKGDGKTYTLIVQTETSSGQSPAMTTFTAGPEWKQYVFPFSAFDTDGSDLTGLGFIRILEPAKFQFQLDQLEIK